MFPFESISAYHTALRNGQTTIVEAVRFFLSSIEANAHLNAFVAVYADEALAQAAQWDAQRMAGTPMGALHGVVVGLKDVIAHEGHGLGAGSKMLATHQALYSATAVERLLAAEAVIIGRQNCDEFAMGSSNENSVHGPVRNGVDSERVPGGSSGGSAVAVQTHQCMVSLGSDTGGSVRQPADFCGTIGFKPSYGRISRHGLVAYASSFDQIGIFAHQVSDIALVLSVIGGPDEWDATAVESPLPQLEQLWAPNIASAAANKDQPLRLAYFSTALHHPALDPAIQTALLNSFEALRQAGHSVTAIDFDLMDYLVPTYYVLTTAEASSNLSRYDGVRFGHRSQSPNTDLSDWYKANRSEGFGAEVKRRILLGTFVLSEGFFDAYFTKAQQVRQLLHQKNQALFQDHDFLLSPTVPTTAFKLGEKSKDPIEMFLADIYTVYANLVGIPGISLPLY
ncbi:MAG: Asp-tRNA(Asn)/Glu-tRNA(Gln) amidotransferase subunit GatA, partial [Sphingobacteriia bacterium]